MKLLTFIAFSLCVASPAFALDDSICTNADGSVTRTSTASLGPNINVVKVNGRTFHETFDTAANPAQVIVTELRKQTLEKTGPVGVAGEKTETTVVQLRIAITPHNRRAGPVTDVWVICKDSSNNAKSFAAQ